jgi:hypothetical protein
MGPEHTSATMPGMSDLLIAPSILSCRLRPPRARRVARRHRRRRRLDSRRRDGRPLSCPNLTIGPLIVAAERGRDAPTAAVRRAPDDRRRPDAWVAALPRGGRGFASRCTPRPARHLHRSLQVMRDDGGPGRRQPQPARAARPASSTCSRTSTWYCIMSVNPGFGGQRFIPGVLPKIRSVPRNDRPRAACVIDIEVDGGVNSRTAFDAAASWRKRLSWPARRSSVHIGLSMKQSHDLRSRGPRMRCVENGHASSGRSAAW